MSNFQSKFNDIILLDCSLLFQCIYDQKMVMNCNKSVKIEEFV